MADNNISGATNMYPPNKVGNFVDESDDEFERLGVERDPRPRADFGFDYDPDSSKFSQITCPNWPTRMGTSITTFPSLVSLRWFYRRVLKSPVSTGPS